jgi:hypothetical protein
MVVSRGVCGDDAVDTAGCRDRFQAAVEKIFTPD